MRTADKRAQLEAAGEPWPLCECHGEPQDWQRDTRGVGGGYFRCSALRREKTEARRAARRGAECVFCGGVLETETMCADHAARHRTVSSRHDQTLKRRLDKYLSNLTYRNTRRISEGFQPTGAGRTLILSYLAGKMEESSRDE